MIGTIIIVLCFYSLCTCISAQDAGKEDETAFPTTLRVTTILEPPYLTFNLGMRNSTTNELFHGYIRDLMDKLAEDLGFEYRLQLVRDGNYGSRRQGKWNGMIGELINDRADIVAAAMFVTKQRAAVVNFSRAFLTVSATVLMKRRKGPKNPIQSAEDLVHQQDIIYGALANSLITRELRSSNNSVHKQIWAAMSSFPDVMMSSYNEGVERVRADPNYAFILTSTAGEFISHRHCDLVTVDKFLFEKDLALAFPKTNDTEKRTWKLDLVDRFNKALDNLDQTGYLDHLYNKWWIQRGPCKHSSKI